MSILRPPVLQFGFYILVACLLISSSTGLAVVERVTTRSAAIAPLSITPSQGWDGNDGKWSSFTLQIGTPPQPVKVLISTASSQTWAIAPEGCQSGGPTDCSQLRGGIYNDSQSSTFIANGNNLSTNIYSLGLESVLGYNGSDYRGRYGFDSITLGFSGSNGPTLANQTIAEIAVPSFFLGYFGLNPTASDFGNESPVQSYLSNLRNQSKIPSLSWGYTAGNQYRSNGVLGSLTLGGYDSSRFTQNDLTFNFSQSDTGYLGVTLDSLTSGSTDLLPDGPITIFIDSTLPFIYLPLSACAVFESTFGLQWNSTLQLYLVNMTQHILLQTQNPAVTFTLSVPNATISSSGSINITLPYSAFDLTASWPMLSSSPTVTSINLSKSISETANYFPLRQANDSSQYILGRTFFQEAYVVADFERGNFSVGACRWDGEPQNLVTILPLNSDNGNKKAKLGVGAIAGIAAGGGVLLALVLFLLWFLHRKTVKAAELANTEIQRTSDAERFNKSELEATSAAHEKDGAAIAEADGVKIDTRQEIDGMALEPVYELPVNEEVAVEMAGNGEVKKGAGKGGKGFPAGRHRNSGGRTWLNNKGKQRGDQTTGDTTSPSSEGRTTPSTPSPVPPYSHLSQESDLTAEIAEPNTTEATHEPTTVPQESGTDTLSSMSSGWGTERSGWGGIVSPETPGSGLRIGALGRGRGNEILS